MCLLTFSMQAEAAKKKAKKKKVSISETSEAGLISESGDYAAKGMMVSRHARYPASTATNYVRASSSNNTPAATRKNTDGNH